MTHPRWAGFAGFAFVALTIASEAAANKPNEASVTDERLLEFYNASGNQYRIFAAAVIAVVAGLLFLWFLTGLRERLAEAGGRTSGFAMLSFAAGVVFVAVWVTEHAVSSAIPATLIYDDNFELRDANLARLILVLGNHWLAGAAATVAALVVGASSVAARAAGIFPSGLVAGGYVIAAILLLSMPAFAGITVVALALWTLIVSFVLVRAPTQ